MYLGLGLGEKRLLRLFILGESGRSWGDEALLRFLTAPCLPLAHVGRSGLSDLLALRLSLFLRRGGEKLMLEVGDWGGLEDGLLVGLIVGSLRRLEVGLGSWVELGWRCTLWVVVLCGLDVGL